MEESGKSNVKRVQVNNSILLNRKLTHYAFALYVELKNKSYNGVSKVFMNDLKDRLGWVKNMQLKRYLGELHANNLIENKIDRISNNGTVEIKLNNFDTKDFTQVDIETIEKIKSYSIGVEIPKVGERDVYEIALRLFYYYERNYNASYGCAFPTYEQINKDTGISPSYIKAINTRFHDVDLVKVTQGEYYTVEINGVKKTKRQNNTYIPMCNRK